MTRYLLLFTLGLAVALPFAPASAQQPTRVPVVAMLVSHAPANDPSFDVLRAGLREYGYEEGRNIRLEIVTAEGELDRLPGLAQGLVRQHVDVIIAPHEVSAQAALTATTTIPIVLAGFGGDPVALGLIDSLRRPGRNITGLYTLAPDLDGKRLEILREVVPGVSRVAVLWDPMFSRSALGEVERAAKSLGVLLEPIEVRSERNLETGFRTAKRKHAGAVMLLSSPIFYVHRSRIAALALELRLPTVSSNSYLIVAGTLVSYTIDNSENWKRTAYYVDRLLRGAKPADLPVEQMSKLKLIVNVKTANALGITIPPSILLRADEVIR
jgi:putative ABC transport system substrate-binding protein